MLTSKDAGGAASGDPWSPFHRHAPIPSFVKYPKKNSKQNMNPSDWIASCFNLQNIPFWGSIFGLPKVPRVNHWWLQQLTSSPKFSTLRPSNDFRNLIWKDLPTVKGHSSLSHICARVSVQYIHHNYIGMNLIIIYPQPENEGYLFSWGFCQSQKEQNLRILLVSTLKRCQVHKTGLAICISPRDIRIRGATCKKHLQLVHWRIWVSRIQSCWISSQIDWRNSSM